MVSHAPKLVIEQHRRNAALTPTIEIGLENDGRGCAVDRATEHLATLRRGTVAVTPQRPVALNDLLHRLRLSDDATTFGDLIIGGQSFRALQTLEIALRVFLKLETFAVGKHRAARRIAIGR